MIERLDLLSDLIRCRPVSADVERVNAASDRVREFLEAEGVSVRVEEVEGRRVVYGSTDGGTCPQVLLNTHVDVVPGGDHQFEPFEKDGWIHGRGTNDCLGNTVIAARVLARLNGQCSVGAVFSADEEIGGATTAAMVDRGYGARKAILVIDGKAYAIAVAQKGVITLTMRTGGKAAHSSAPWLGRNAIDALIDSYQRVRGLFPGVEPGDEWHNTLVLSKIHGGTVANRVPDEAELTLNIRYTEPGGAESIVEEIRRLSGAEVAVQMTCPPVVFDENEPVFQELATTMGRAFGREIAMIRMNGATDARHFAALSVPVAILGIPGRDTHGADESAEISALEAYEDMLVDYLGVVA